MTHWLDGIMDILEAETTDLRELAKIAGANPETFYRGANFRKSDLRYQQLTGLDLTNTKIDNCSLTDEQRKYLEEKNVTNVRFTVRTASKYEEHSAKYWSLIAESFEQMFFYLGLHAKNQRGLFADVTGKYTLDVTVDDNVIPTERLDVVRQLLATRAFNQPEVLFVSASYQHGDQTVNWVESRLAQYLWLSGQEQSDMVLGEFLIDTLEGQSKERLRKNGTPIDEAWLSINGELEGLGLPAVPSLKEFCDPIGGPHRSKFYINGEEAFGLSWS